MSSTSQYEFISMDLDTRQLEKDVRGNFVVRVLPCALCRKASAIMMKPEDEPGRYTAIKHHCSGYGGRETVL